MAMEQSGVELVLEGLNEFLSGMQEAEGSTVSLADIAGGIGAAGLDALGGAMGMVADIAGSVLSAGLDIAVQGVQALAGGLTDGIRSAMEGEEAISSLNQVIRSTGGAAGLTSEDAQALAQQFAHLAGGSDDAVLAIETLGLRMGTISAAEMPQFIQASLDLGAVMGNNTTAAKLLARAQEDPVGTMGQLRRAGILVSEELEANIKDMVAAGDQAGAYALLMDRVAEATTGAAAAQGETLAGTWERITGTLGEAAETIGAAFLPTLHSLADMIEGFIPTITHLAEVFGFAFQYILSGDIGAGIDNVREGLFGMVPPEVIEFIAGLLLNLQSFVGFVQANLPLMGETFDSVFGNVSQLTSDLALVWSESLGPALSNAFTTIFGQGPTAQQILESLLSALSTGAELAAAWVRDTLVPAVEQFSEWIVNDFTPNAVLLREWLEVNIPIAVQTLTDLWTNVLLPTIQMLTDNWNNITMPALTAMYNWLATTIPAAITTLSNFWTNTLMPPVVAAVVYWNTSLLPAFTAVYDFINTNVVPVLTSLGAVFTEVNRIVGEVFILTWNTVLKPALNTVWKFIQDNINPILTEMGRVFSEVIGPAVDTFKTSTLDPLKSAFDSLAGALQSVRDWLDRIAEALANIHIPGNLKPGSPTPFEIGLRGAADAASELVGEMKNLDRLGAGYSGPGVGFTSGIQRIAELVVDKMTVSALQVTGLAMPQLTTSAPPMHAGYQGGPSGGLTTTNYTVNQSNHYARYSDPATVYDDTKLAFAFL